MTYWLIAVAAAGLVLALIGHRLRRRLLHSAASSIDPQAPATEPMMHPPSPRLDRVDSLDPRIASSALLAWWRRLG